MNSSSPIIEAQLLPELAAVTRDYARYADAAGGWSAIIGGALALISLVVGAAFAATPPVRLSLLAMPCLWLLSKYLAVRHYQRHGAVQALTDVLVIRVRLGLLAGVVAILGIVFIGSIADSAKWRVSDLAYIGILLAMPLVAAKWLRTPLDLVIGSFLFCQAALAASGSSFGRSPVAWLVLPAALLLIAHGVHDHRNFRALEARITRIRQTLGMAS